MHRIYAISTTAFLFIAVGALILPKAISSIGPGVEASNLPQARDWSRYLPSDRSACLKSVMRGSGTHTDLLNCLEAAAVARRVPRNPGPAAR